jgi:pimeloyl-ACP methyl ester carboxylesterase
MYAEHLRIPIGVGALHVERVGRGGPPVVLLHGLGTCTFLWRRLSPALAAAGYTALAIDLLGHGESDHPFDANFTLPAQAEHLARALDALRLPAAAVIGQDIGGLVALLLAANPRARVDALMLLSPPDPDDLPGPEVRALQRASARLALNAHSLFGAHPALEGLLRAGVSTPEHMSDLLVARYVAPFVGGDGLNRLLQRGAAVEMTEEARATLDRVAVPTWIIEGVADGDRGPIIQWHTLLPNARVSIEQLEGVGRLVPEDAPERFIGLVLAWLAAQRTP